MTTRWPAARALVFAAVAVVALAAPPVEAQGGDGALAPSLSGEAKALYEIGRTLFERGDVAAALAKFTRAHELSDDVRLLWNMAACEASLKHYARAMILVDRYLATSGDLISEKDREQAARFRAAARPLVAIVSLATTPDDAAVTVDGEPAGTTPLGHPLYLDEGQRRVHVTKPGYRGVVRVVTVDGGTELTWSIELERLRIQRLEISAPSGAGR